MIYIKNNDLRIQVYKINFKYEITKIINYGFF